MPKSFGSAIDFLKIPAFRFVFESSASAPTSPVNGQAWHDTTNNQFKVYLNGAWVRADSGGSAPLVHTHAISDVTGLSAALAGKVDTTRLVSTGLGLTGGGDLSADRTHAVDFAASGTSSATKAVRADDSRLADSRAPSGAAGGSLAGTYPSPTIAAGAVGGTEIAGAIKDPAAGTAGLRTLGTGAAQALAGNTRLDQITAPTAAVPLNGQKITGLADPTGPQDAATKAYVDAQSLGLDIKASVRAASVGNLTLSATQTVDGVALIAGDRVLAKDQTTPATNGIYVVAAGAWTRATDADSSAEVNSGLFTFVEEGTVNDNSGWVLTTNNPITLGTTGLSFSQFSGAGSIVPGAGLTQTGSTFDVVGTTNRVVVLADSIDISPNYVGQTSITTLGTITTGTWTATAVGVLYGGTGATTAAGARTNLGAVGKYAATLGALTAGAETTITHSLGSTDVHAMFRDASTGADILFSWRVIDANSIGITADVAYSASAVRVVVMG